MAVNNPNFALDLTPEGVNLWQRGSSGDWLGLGFVPNTSEKFTQAVADYRVNAAQSGRNAAEIRIAKSDVYFTRIKTDLVPAKPTDQAVLALIADRIPFRDKAARLIVDTCPRGSGDLAVAVVPAKVLEDAAEFAMRHGFAPSYFTTLNNPMTFPAAPRFRLAKPAAPLPAPKTPPKRRRAVAVLAGIALAILGLALVREAAFAPSGPAGHAEDSVALEAGAYPVPASVILPQPPLQLPGTIATGNTGPTPAFAADIAAPPTLPKTPLQIAVAPEAGLPVVTGASPQPRNSVERLSAQASRPTQTGFERSGLATRTMRLLNNSFISIEEPAAGQTGRKTIRILPSDLGRGSRNRHFDPQSFVRVAQVQTANDATSGLPDVDNPLLRVTEDGVPLFEGPPDAVPPPRPGSPTPPDSNLKTFSDGIAQVLDGTTAAPPAADVSGIRIRKALLGTIRPRPNPLRKQAQAPAAQPDNGYPVKTASAATLRPKPRPASPVRKLLQQDINAAAKEAIRETMPTVNALFVSLLPKPRPDDLQERVARTKPGLTTVRSGSKAVVRTAPTGGGQSSGNMTTSNTPKSVAALATESARISKHSLSLIGIFGTSSARRALLRLPTGRYIKVKQGDDVGGWNVSAIGESSVRIKKGSRDEVLRMPE